MFQLQVIKRNSLGDPQYGEAALDTPSSSLVPNIQEVLLPDQFWTVKSPSDSLSTWLKTEHSAVERIYEGVTFLMSPKASKVIPVEGHGRGACINVRYEHKGHMYSIFVVDNKFYAQACQGAAMPEETFRQCAERRLWDVLRIKVNEDDNLKVVGEWTFAHRNDLIDYTRSSCTSAMLLNLNVDRVSHLFPQGMDDQWNVVDVDQLAESLGCLDQTLFVISVRDDYVEQVPEKLSFELSDGTTIERSFGGHHSEFIKACAGLFFKTEFSHLETFKLDINI